MEVKKRGSFPDAPCMNYLPTLGEKWLHSRGNVGKYSLHGAFGFFSETQENVKWCELMLNQWSWYNLSCT